MRDAMNTRFRWNVGTDQASHAGAVTAPDFVQSKAPRKTRFALTRGFIASYAFALLAAAGGGFGLGRWSEARGVVTYGVESGLAVEALAWSDADIGLFESRLDPHAPPEWRADTLANFAREAPQSWSARVVEMSIDGETVTVSLEIESSDEGYGQMEDQRQGVGASAADGGTVSRQQVRRYRSIGGSWVWSQP